MTVRLELPPEVAERLNDKAQQRGLSLDAYILQSVLQTAGSENSVDDEESRRRREVAADNIRRLRENITLGPDLTIRDLINEGRRY